MARAGALRDAGHSRRAVSDAIARGELLRVRRDWVAVPDADADLVSASRSGVVLSCVTQARRLGLWVTRVDRPHVSAAPNGAGRKPAGLHVHWARPLVSRQPDALVDPIENVLALVATCQPYEDARSTWESAFRSGAVDRGILEGLALGPAARRILDEIWGGYDSGLETIFAVRLRWLRVPIRSQAWLLGHHVDFLVGARLVVQIDGAHHVGPQRDSDIAHDALLALHGYHVLRFSYVQVMSDWHTVQDTIVRAIARGLHLD